MAQGEQYVRDISEQQRISVMADLRNKYEQGVSALEAQEATIDPRYLEQATAADVATQQASRRLQEIMQNRGYATGQQWGQTGAMLASGQQARSALGLQRQGAFDELGRQRTNLATGYASAQTGAEADIQAQLIQNLYNEYIRSQSRGGGGGGGGGIVAPATGAQAFQNLYNVAGAGTGAAIGSNLGFGGAYGSGQQLRGTTDFTQSRPGAGAVMTPTRTIVGPYGASQPAKPSTKKSTKSRSTLGAGGTLTKDRRVIGPYG
jgi:hypothetical protein